jgi:chromosomal replication initiator protein
VQKEITVDHIVKKVCSYYQMDASALQTKSRKREIVQARQAAMYFCNNLTSSSLSAIGSQIGQRDHSTVLYACKAVKNLMETNVSYKKQIREIELLIRR